MNCARFTRLLLLALLMLALPLASFAGLFVSITVAPPPLPVYVQPVCPEPGYLWTPGYWAWGDDGYYWVPGTWVPAPAVGLLWTPGYWGWNDGYYAWNGGYWGPHVGFYGGVNYGFGYGGEGFFGGEWRGGGFYYNSAVVNVDRTRITNVYVNKTVIVNNTTVNNVSYNGGTGGIRRAPTPAEQAAVRENHVQPTPQQTQHAETARSNPALLARNNGGRPAIAATAKPGDFSRAVPARAAGGRINTATLRATPQSMPAAGRNFAGQQPNSRASTPARQNAPGALNAGRTPSGTVTRGQTPQANRPQANSRTVDRGFPGRAPNASNPQSGPAIRGGQPNFSGSTARPSGSVRQPNSNNRQPSMDSRPSARPERPQAFSPSRSQEPRYQAPQVQSRPAPAAPSRSFARPSPPPQPHYAAPARQSAPAARPQQAPRQNEKRQ